MASNVVVSFLKIGDNFPVVTFPPISFDSVEELRSIISDNGDSYDVVHISDFEMPDDDKKADLYIQERMDQFNLLVMKYVEMCKSKERNPIPVIEGDGVKDYLDALANLSIQYRKSQGIAREAAKLKVDKFLEKFSSNHPQFDLDNYRRVLTYPGQKGEDLAELYLKKYDAISVEKYEIASDLKQRIQEIERAG
ncbi:MAG: hypothetical protein HUU45_12280 [Leptospiraceae bacterium]|nr:hypothetical protein [Leptospiraceae bacterium]